MLLVVFADAAPRVFHFDLEFANVGLEPVFLEADSHLDGARRSELDCVAQVIHQNLLQPRIVRPNVVRYMTERDNYDSDVLVQSLLLVNRNDFLN